MALNRDSRVVSGYPALRVGGAEAAGLSFEEGCFGGPNVRQRPTTTSVTTSTANPAARFNRDLLPAPTIDPL
jgi:hypothetical protein